MRILTSLVEAVTLLYQALGPASCDMGAGYRRPRLAVEPSSQAVGLEVVCTFHLAAGDSSLVAAQVVVYTF